MLDVIFWCFNVMVLVRRFLKGDAKLNLAEILAAKWTESFRKPDSKFTEKGYCSHSGVALSQKYVPYL